ncbi:MAG: hypothetical protein WKG03_20650 [Telluria sp.]
MDDIFPGATQHVKGLSEERIKLITAQGLAGVCAVWALDMIARGVHKRVIDETRYNNLARVQHLIEKQRDYQTDGDLARIAKRFHLRSNQTETFSWSGRIGDEDYDDPIDTTAAQFMYVQCDFNRDGDKLGHAMFVGYFGNEVHFGDPCLGLWQVNNVRPDELIHKLTEVLGTKGGMGKCTGWRANVYTPLSPEQPESSTSEAQALQASQASPAPKKPFQPVWD